MNHTTRAWIYFPKRINFQYNQTRFILWFI